ncbi:glycosyltransferase [Rheinheimera sp. MMS21-TC3]|uniref:glycosyltransferase family 2 protein n=1 Tax=Rheinheimera sp. MMS21-TC3 TaxID=3072790 RepID=UPI0028C4A160|nr:glycosyltransferase [Rheinheimera sp. MMS21-TC3]WNO59645.1 glycosyltransferase [Rheinheimera sp. MMS21-TC3]
MIEQALVFLFNLNAWQLLGYFWPFFIIDMVRYVIIEGLVLLYYLPKRKRSASRYNAARKQLFKQKPLISIIVPGKNEGKHIPKLVQTLSEQSYPFFELIVVDDGSDDDTPQICLELERQGMIDCFIRNSIRGGKASAANTALQFTRGNYIVHIDADSHMASDALETIMLPFFMDPDIGCVGGDVRVANYSDSFATQVQGVEYSKSLMLSRTVSSQLGILRIVSGAYGAFRKDVLDKIYGWDVGPGLDGDITLKIRKLGYKVVHEPASVCYTNVPQGFWKLAKQRFRWDKSMIRFRLRKHRDILLPSAEFKWSNFIAVADNLIFNLFFDIKWFIYFFYIIQLNPTYIAFLLIINYLLYFASNLVQWLFSVIVQRRLGQTPNYQSVMFILLMPLYTGVFLRFIRTFSYVMEIVNKSSYVDKWNPWKVSKIAKQNKL